MIRIVIAEDHHVVAEAIATLLMLADGIEVVGVAASGEEVVALVLERRPDVVLMDITLVGMDGIDATKQIHADTGGAVPVLMLTMHDDEEVIANAVAAGAAGYLPKNVARDELVDAIRAVAQGQGVLHPSVTRPFLDRVVALGVGGRKEDDITPRELDVLALLADGKSTKQIADALIVSDETVKTHLKHLYQKLGVRDRAQAVATAFRRGLVQ